MWAPQNSLAVGEALHTSARLEAAWRFSVWTIFMKLRTVNTGLFFSKAVKKFQFLYM